MKNKPPFIDKHHGTCFAPLEQEHFQVTNTVWANTNPWMQSEVTWMQSNSLSVPADHLQLWKTLK